MVADLLADFERSSDLKLLHDISVQRRERLADFAHRLAEAAKNTHGHPVQPLDSELSHIPATSVTAASEFSVFEFYDFVKRYAHQLATHSQEVVTLARNSAADGQVATLADEACAILKRPWVSRINRSTSSDRPAAPMVMLGSSNSPIQCVDLAVNGRIAITGCENGSVDVWDMHLRRHIHCLQGHTASIYAVSIGAEGERAISISDDGSARAWNLNTWTCEHVFETTRPAGGVGISADGLVAAIGFPGAGQTHNGQVRVVQGDDWRTETNLPVGGTLVDRVVIAPDGRAIISSSPSGYCLDIWRRGAKPRRIPLPHKQRRALYPPYIPVAVTCDARKAIVSAIDPPHEDAFALSVYDLIAGCEEKRLRGHSRQVFDVSITPDARFAVSTSYGGEMRLWDVAQGECICELSTRCKLPFGCAISADAGLLLCATEYGNLHVWETDRLQTIDPDNQSRPILKGTHVALEDDSGTALTAIGSEIRSWKLDSPEDAVTIELDKSVQSLGFLKSDVAIASSWPSVTFLSLSDAKQTGSQTIRADYRAAEIDAQNVLGHAPFMYCTPIHGDRFVVRVIYARAATVSRGDEFWVIDRNTRESHLLLQSHMLMAHAVNSTGQVAALAQWHPPSLHVVDIEARDIQRMECREAPLQLAFLPHSTQLLVGNESGQIDIYDIPSRKRIRTLATDSSPNGPIRVTSNGRYVLTTRSGGISVIDIDSDREITWYGSEEHIIQLSNIDRHDRLLAISVDESIHILALLTPP